MLTETPSFLYLFSVPILHFLGVLPGIRTLSRHSPSSYNLLAALVSAVLYFMVIKTLRATRQTPRKVALVRAFVSLYVLWLFCFVPYDVMDFVYMRYAPVQTAFNVPVLEPSNVKWLIENGSARFEGRKKRWVYCEMLLGTLRFSYGFFNSLLLLIILKPFQEPLKKFIGFFIKQKDNKQAVAF